jgi:hypothetical protein
MFAKGTYSGSKVYGYRKDDLRSHNISEQHQRYKKLLEAAGQLDEDDYPIQTARPKKRPHHSSSSRGGHDEDDNEVFFTNPSSAQKPASHLPPPRALSHSDSGLFHSVQAPNHHHHHHHQHHQFGTKDHDEQTMIYDDSDQENSVSAGMKYPANNGSLQNLLLPSSGPGLSGPASPFSAAMLSSASAANFAPNPTTNPGIFMVQPDLMSLSQQQQQQQQTQSMSNQDVFSDLRLIAQETAIAVKTANLKTDSVCLHLERMNRSLSAIKSTLEAQERRQSLQWAITNADMNGFLYYYFYQGSVNELGSGGLVRYVLSRFLKGQGMYIEDRRMSDGSAYANLTSAEERQDKLEQDQKTFREKLVDQIHGLTGVKPRIDKDDKGYSIHYPCA